MGEIKSRSFTYRSQIKVSRGDLRLARQGKKTCTIRLGTAAVEEHEIDLTDGHDRVRVRIGDVETDRAYEDITDEDAMADGLGNVLELDKDLRRFYGPINPKQPMTLIHFTLLDSTGLIEEPPKLFD